MIAIEGADHGKTTPQQPFAGIQGQSGPGRRARWHPRRVLDWRVSIAMGTDSVDRTSAGMR